jgi:hypothetical protein
LITTPLSRSSHGSRRYCFIYKESSPDLVLFSTSADNCDRVVRPGITGELVFNVTSTGKCVETSSSGETKALLLLTLYSNILKYAIVALIQR